MKMGVLNNILFWFVSNVPYAYEISKFLSERSSLPMIEGVHEGDSLMNFSGVILGATFIAIINFIYRMIGNIFLKRMWGNPKVIEFLFNQASKESLLASVVYFIAGSMVGWLCAPLAGMVTGYIEDVLMNNMAIEDKRLVAFLICVILFFISAIINNVIHWLDNGNKSYFPIVRAFTVTIMPDILKLFTTTFVFVLGYMFYIDESYLYAFLCWLAGCALSWGIYILGDIVEACQVIYYGRVKRGDTISNTFGMVSELGVLLIFYQIMSVNIVTNPTVFSNLLSVEATVGGSESILVKWMSYMPFLTNFVKRESMLTTYYNNPSAFYIQLLELMLLCVIFCSLRRTTYLIPKAAAIPVEGFGWWLITVLIFSISIGLYYGVIYGLNAAWTSTVSGTGPGVIIGIMVLVFIAYCCFCPPVIQHAIIIPFCLVLLSVFMEATGIGGSFGITMDNIDYNILGFCFYTLFLFGAGYALGIVRAATKPRKLIL